MIRVIILTKGMTGVPIVTVFPVPDSVGKAHRRVKQAIQQYKEENTPPGKELGDCDTAGLEHNSKGLVILMLAQDAPSSETDLVKSRIEEAIANNEPKFEADSGPSS